jgi:hypothetical protein
MAQVFSANIVGYYNRTIPGNQFALLASQLKNGSNNISSIISGSHDGDLLYVWTGSGYASAQYLEGIGWDPDREIPPGTGFFYKNTFSNAVTLTFVGEVSTGSLSNSLPAGLSLKGAIVPQAGDLETIHGIQGGNGDFIYKWTGTGYSTQNPQYFDGVGWDPAPVVVVGEGFFYKNAGAAKTWVRTFNP